MKTISLCMIVKNESHVIERCLDSVKPLIDYLLIQDTGSTDSTIEIIESWMISNNISGTVFREEWKDFAYNRSLSLERLREIKHIDYALMIDADEILVFDDSFDVNQFKSELHADLYDITTRMSSISYYRPQLSSNKIQYKYEGVVHEFITGPTKAREKVNGFHNRPIQDSHRNKSGNKFEQDVIVLKNALDDTNDEWFKSRYTFYLAQTLRDLQRREESLKYYLERTKMGFWEEEVFISYYCAGNLMKELNYTHSEIIHTYLKGHETCPSRIECLFSALHFCRIIGMNNFGYILGKQALEIKKPQSALFSEEWMYDYGVYDEFSIVSYFVSDFTNSKKYCELLLSENKIPNHYTERIKSNLTFSINKLS
jgi:glycosyltransferase involved in cell wall biosynthesis